MTIDITQYSPDNGLRTYPTDIANLITALQAMASGAKTPFNYKPSTTTGLTFGYYGGLIQYANAQTLISDGTVALTNNATNYVEATRAGTVSANTSGFTAGRLPLYQVVTSGGGITSITEKREVRLSPGNKSSFSAYRSSVVNDVTGNGANYDVVFNSEIFDTWGEHNAGTGVFTASVGGRYSLSAGALLVDLSTAALLATVSIVTSNRTWTYQTGLNPKASALQHHATLSILADMDAGDTAFVRVNVTGMAGNTADVYGTTAPFTYFCGSLEVE